MKLCHKAASFFIIFCIKDIKFGVKSVVAKKNKALSVRVIVICSDHKLLRWDSYRGVGRASTSPESILHKIIIIFMVWSEESRWKPSDDLSNREKNKYWIDYWRKGSALYTKEELEK